MVKKKDVTNKWQARQWLPRTERPLGGEGDEEIRKKEVETPAGRQTIEEDEEPAETVVVVRIINVAEQAVVVAVATAEGRGEVNLGSRVQRNLREWEKRHKNTQEEEEVEVVEEEEEEEALVVAAAERTREKKVRVRKERKKRGGGRETAKLSNTKHTHANRQIYT